MIKPLPNPFFLPEFIRTINSAEKSILLVNYLAELEDGKMETNRALQIARALVSASKRKVQINVFLEGSKFASNYPFYRYLKDRGVDAWMDTSATFIHQKIMLADRKILITGSHNISAASLGSNVEFSVATDDAATIKLFEETLVEIAKQREEVKGKSCKEFIALPGDLPWRVLAPLHKVHALLPLNLYLLMCLDDRGTPKPLRIDYKGWGVRLGFDEKNAGKDTTPAYRQFYNTARIGRLLGQLKKAGLIEIDRGSDTAKRTAPPADPKKAQGPIKIPLTFWTNGWWKRLSLPAKFLYVISLVETKDSPSYPWWSMPQWKIKEKYGCSGKLKTGADELERLGILEILRGIPVRRGGGYKEEAQFYRHNPV